MLTLVGEGVVVFLGEGVLNPDGGEGAPVSYKWSFSHAPVPCESEAPPSATLSVPGKLYAVGGYDGASRQCLSTVEQYNPATNEWTYVADMSTRRSGAGMGRGKVRGQAVSDLTGGSGGQELNILPYFPSLFSPFSVYNPTCIFAADTST